MAVTYNMKGTSFPSLQIGKDGVTLYQGSDDPSTFITSPKRGDIYFKKGNDQTTPSIMVYDGSKWQSETSEDGVTESYLQSNFASKDSLKNYLPIQSGSTSTTLSGTQPLVFDYPSTSFSGTVTVPTSSDFPGKTSQNIASTNWVDEYYASKSAINDITSKINGLSSSEMNFLPTNSTTSQNLNGNGTLNISYSQGIQFQTTSSFNNGLVNNTNITDVPGTTSNNVATTKWVDTNYASKNALSSLQTTWNYFEANGLITSNISTGATQNTYNGPYQVANIIYDDQNYNIIASYKNNDSNSLSDAVITTSTTLNEAISGLRSEIFNQIVTSYIPSISALSAGYNNNNEGTQGSQSVTIGTNCAVSASGGIATGYGATSNSANGIAIGLNSQTAGLNSIALGSNSTTSESDVLSIGSSNSNGNYYRRITNVADGVNSHDAVTLEQLQKYVSNSSNSGNISGTVPSTSGSTGSNATNIYSDSNGNVQYTDTNNGTRQIALASTPKGLINKQIFSTPGQYTYTPTPGTTKIIIKLCGGGGGGSGAANATYLSANSFSVGLGGGGGNYAESTLITSGFSGVQVTVGAGGAGGPTYDPSVDSSWRASRGGDGGVSSVGTLITCAGGIGAQAGVFGPLVPYTVSGVLGRHLENYNKVYGDGYNSLAYHRLGGEPLPPVVCFPAKSDYSDGSIIGSRGGDSFFSSVSDVTGVLATNWYTGYGGYDASGYGGGGGGGAIYNLTGSTNSYNNGTGGAGGPGIVIIEEYA